ncbi:E3 ubiquitin-protein ligase RNF19A [Nymphon striatum]|nr:E3 ubiquitin-protein ligase RNF19A [Nymphon striatum]
MNETKIKLPQGDGGGDDSHSMCSSIQSAKNNSPKKSRRTKRRGIGINFHRFSLRSFFYDSPLGRRLGDASAMLSMRERRQANVCEGSSSSDSSSNFVTLSKATGKNQLDTGNHSGLLSTAGASQADAGLEKTNENASESRKFLECPLCLIELPIENFPKISTCRHRSCCNCLQQYLSIEISESRVNIACPVCVEAFNPSDLQALLENSPQSQILMMKYQDFMVRRVLLHTEPDTRWCPAPDCNYAVIASGCASCPKLQCESPGCETYFCYHCKQEWHPNQTCDAARAERSPNMYNMYHHGSVVRSSSLSFSQGSNTPQRYVDGTMMDSDQFDEFMDLQNDDSVKPIHAAKGQLMWMDPLVSQKYEKLATAAQLKLLPFSTTYLVECAFRDDIKPCPRCQVLIVKMDDGSCNHITCLICGSEFCWLCMKEISDLHYLSPSGCTFWGKKPWSRKKKVLWQLGTLVGAPLGIGLVAGIAVPAMIIGIPVWIGIKIHNHYKKSPKRRRNMAISGGVAASILVSPLIAGVAVSIGVPVLLAYVYGVVPVSLCRSGGCGVSTSPSGGVKIIDFNDEDDDHNDQISGLSVGGALSGSYGHNLDSVSVSQQSGSQAVNYQSISAGNPSIGEASIQGCSVSASISFGGDSQHERMGNICTKEQEDMFPEADRESTSTRALAGSIASSTLVNSSNQSAQSKVDFQQSDVNSNKRFSLSSASLSEKSNTMSMTNDDACSTKALAGSIVGYREATAYNAPVEVHVDALPLDLTIRPESPNVTIVNSEVNRNIVSQPVESYTVYRSSLVDTSTQTISITDVSVNPIITTSIMYPRALATGGTSSHKYKDLDGAEIYESSDVGVQVETLEHKDPKDETSSSDKPICDKVKTSCDEN